jgi:Uma2 family endonuclease
MSTVAEPTRITAEQFAELSFDVRTELVRGRIVELPQTDLWQGIVVSNVAFCVERWNRQTNWGIAAVYCNVFTSRDPDCVRRADLILAANERLPRGRVAHESHEFIPNVVVSTSLSLARSNDVLERIGEYLNCGVDEVWVVDLQRHSVEIFGPHQGPVLYDESDELTSTVLPGFSCRVSEFFRGI